MQRRDSKKPCWVVLKSNASFVGPDSEAEAGMWQLIQLLYLRTNAISPT
jgi:hypothetical protein